MLADDAAEAGGKLYVHGGAWDRIQTSTLPTTIARMALVIAFSVDYNEALKDHPILIDLVDDDDKAAGGIHLSGVIKVGHPPGIQRGDPTSVAQVIRLENLFLDRLGGYRFRVFDGDELLASARFQLADH